MSRGKHRRIDPTPVSPVAAALAFTDSDLADLARLWPLALEQLQLASDAPPRLREAPTPEQQAARAQRDRQERTERFFNAQAGRVPLAGASPAPLRVSALEDLAIAEAGIVDLADQVTGYIRRSNRDRKLGPHRLRRQRLPQTAPPRRTDSDELGYPLHLGYGRFRATGGRQLAALSERHDRDAMLSAIRWLRAALPAIVDEPFAEQVAAEVSRIRRTVRGVAGYPDLQIRLSPRCFVCDQPSLRMNVDRRYIECRNVACTPTEEQCMTFGPHGQPRWYDSEWAWLKQQLRDELGYPLNLGYGRSFDDEVRAVLREAS